LFDIAADLRRSPVRLFSLPLPFQLGQDLRLRAKNSILGA
jgi:hypothetical protein